MEAEISQIISIYLLSTIKFLSGPLLGYAAGLNIFITMIITVAGMMTSVILFTYFGTWLRKRILRRFLKPKRVFSSRSRRFVKIWKNYGAGGVAFFTPILLMPIGGAILLSTTGTPRKKIIYYMLLSAIGWSIVQTTLFYIAGDQIQALIN